ncbi:hypothetical protein M011DRAFT_119454 [Sporormia fimetaria CBS 119925]|uniref:Uncharacterized protein n=1 Tax=Sporormia fimetaria CBS 119925 TaxID=1340428 RepID=A0A6A6VPA5_9PLEO|nr:hypothetical protein M011DRAFT_119454 [Sporormia fimetaria CBS 119925]
MCAIASLSYSSALLLSRLARTARCWYLPSLSRSDLVLFGCTLRRLSWSAIPRRISDGLLHRLSQHRGTTSYAHTHDIHAASVPHHPPFTPLQSSARLRVGCLLPTSPPRAVDVLPSTLAARSDASRITLSPRHRLNRPQFYGRIPPQRTQPSSLSPASFRHSFGRLRAFTATPSTAPQPPRVASPPLLSIPDRATHLALPVPPRHRRTPRQFRLHRVSILSRLGQWEGRIPLYCEELNSFLDLTPDATRWEARYKSWRSA